MFIYEIIIIMQSELSLSPILKSAGAINAERIYVNYNSYIKPMM